MKTFELGKIEKCDFVIVDGWRTGFEFTLSMNGGGSGAIVFDWWHAKKTRDEHTPRCVWNPIDVEKALVNNVDKLEEMMKLAKVDKFSQLKGVPIEVELDGLNVKGFRILTEVL